MISKNLVRLSVVVAALGIGSSVRAQESGSQEAAAEPAVVLQSEAVAALNALFAVTKVKTSEDPNDKAIVKDVKAFQNAGKTLVEYSLESDNRPGSNSTIYRFKAVNHVQGHPFGGAVLTVTETKRVVPDATLVDYQTSLVLLRGGKLEKVTPEDSEGKSK